MSQKTNIKLEIKEDSNYNQRFASRLLLLVVVAFFLAIVLGEYGNHGPPMGLGMSFTIVIVVLAAYFFFSNDPLNIRYFITCFEMNGDHVSLSYKDKMELHKIEGKKSDFKADLKTKWAYRSYTMYLEIRYKDQVILKQLYSTWKNEKVKSEILACLKEHSQP